MRLLQAWAGARVDDPDAVRQICHLVGYLPLAVRLVGRYLAQRGQSARLYLDWLESSPLQALDQGQRREESVPLLLDRSLAQVSDGARAVSGVVGVLALSPLDAAPAAAALELPPVQAHHLLGELVDYDLLVCPDDGYQVSHALVHTYARQRCVPTADTVARLAAHYDALAREQSELGSAGYARLDKERAHLLSVLGRCADPEQWEAVRSLVWAIDGYLNMQGHWMDHVQVLQAGMAAAQHLAHRRDEGAFLGSLGIAYHSLGQVERAIEHYTQALAIFREIDDRSGEGATLGNLSNAYYSLGQVEQAIEHYTQALAIFREIGDRRGEGTHLGNLGIAYHSLGQVERAIEHHQAALLIAREIGDRRSEGNHLGNLGNTYYSLGQVERAIEHHQAALLITREIGDRRSEGNHLGNLGLAYTALGQVERAIEHYQSALLTAREIGDRRSEGAHLGNLGNAYHSLGQVERAIGHHTQALLIAREIGDRRGEGNALGSLGLAYAGLGQMERAIDHYTQALAISREIGDRRGEGSWLANLGSAYYSLGQMERAAEHAEAALRIFEEIKSPAAEQVRRRLSEWRGQRP